MFIDDFTYDCIFCGSAGCRLCSNIHSDFPPIADFEDLTELLMNSSINEFDLGKLRTNKV